MSDERRTSNGRRWPGTKSRPDRWNTFRYVVIREAVYRMAAHPFLTDRNLEFRIQLRDLHDHEVLALFRSIERDWPARKIRP